MALTIKGNTYQPFNAVTAAMTNGTYYCVPGMGAGAPPRETAPEFEDIEIMFPTVPGIGTTRVYPFGPRMITCDLAFVNTLAGALAAAASLRDSLTQLARYTIVLPGTLTRNGCKLVSASSIGQMAMNGKTVVVYSFVFKQRSDTN